MRKNLVLFICTITIVLAIISSGCVAPPKDTVPATSATGTGTNAGTNAPASGSSDMSAACTTETISYVTEETPFAMSTPVTTAYRTILPVTPVPEDYVQIYGKTQYFAYNKTAFSFDLKNPPMIIDFSVKPVNNTGTNTIESRSGGHGDETVAYNYFSPSSWYQVTVRNKDTGEIILQDGFQNGYSQQADNRTMKILTHGNLLVELGGNQITAITNVSVKRSGNIINATE